MSNMARFLGILALILISGGCGFYVSSQMGKKAEFKQVASTSPISDAPVVFVSTSSAALPAITKVYGGVFLCDSNLPLNGDSFFSKNCSFRFINSNDSIVLPDIKSLPEARQAHSAVYSWVGKREENGAVYVGAKIIPEDLYGESLPDGQNEIYRYEPSTQTLTHIFTCAENCIKIPHESYPMNELGVYVHYESNATSTQIYRDFLINGEMHTDEVALIPNEGGWNIGHFCDSSEPSNALSVMDQNTLVVRFTKCVTQNDKTREVIPFYYLLSMPSTHERI